MCRRPEIDSGFCPFSGLEFENILPCIKMCIDNKKNISPCHIPTEYNTSKASRVITNIILSQVNIVKDAWRK